MFVSGYAEVMRLAVPLLYVVVSNSTYIHTYIGRAVYSHPDSHPGF